MSKRLVPMRTRGLYGPVVPPGGAKSIGNAFSAGILGAPAPSTPIPAISGTALFDGTNDYLTRGGDLTGNADGKHGIISFWHKRGATGTLQFVFSSSSGPGYANLQFNTLNQVQLTITDSGATIQLQLKGAAPTDTTDWHHYLFAWDVANNYAEIYIDDVATYFTPTKNNATLDYTQGEWYFGSSASTTSKLNGCLAGLYINFAEFLDMSVAANRRLFIDANGKPVSLGADGSTPTGTAPLVYLEGRASDFITNKGSGGGMSHWGNLTSCTTSPSDFDILPVDFDGVNDRLSLVGDLTGNADGQLGTISFWFKIDGGDGTNRTLLANANSRVLIYMNTTNKLVINMTDTAGTLRVNLATTATILAGSGWHHCMASWDASVSALGHMYVDGNLVDGVSGGSANNLDYTNTSGWGVMARQTGTQKWNGCIGQFYINFAEYVDLTVEANRRKFLTLGLGPVDMGTDGSTPTGTQPIIYLHGNASNFATNLGSGGGFTLTGTLDNCTDGPEPNLIVATEFDGSSYYTRAASDLVGAADSKVATISFWIKIDAAGDGTNRGIFEFANSEFFMYLATSNQIILIGYNAAGALILNSSSATAYPGSANWRHVMVSFDSANARWDMYVDGSSVGAATVLVDDFIDMTVNPFSVGMIQSLNMDGCIAELYINTAEYVDLTVAANREKFRTNIGLAANLGADGSNPTGNQPIVYLKGGAEDFGVNFGSGGNVDDTITGTPVNCADSPAV